LQYRHLRVPEWRNSYLLKVEGSIILIVPDGVVLLIVETDASFVFSYSSITEGFKEVVALVNDDVVLDVGVLLILDLEVVRRELSNWEVGATDRSLVADDVGSFSDLAVQKIVHVGFVCLHE
jgi:hypothetical protein